LVGNWYLLYINYNAVQFDNYLNNSPSNLYYSIYFIDGKTITSSILNYNSKINVEYLNSGMCFLSIRTKDEYMNEARMQYELQRVQELFGNDVTIIPFEGAHMVNVELINSML
jgi:hypothetical protein